jgi:hypothetical protein
MPALVFLLIVIGIFFWAEDEVKNSGYAPVSQSSYSSSWVHVDGVKVLDKVEETRRQGKFRSQYYLLKIEKNGESIMVVVKDRSVWSSMQVGTTLDLDYNMKDMSLGAFTYTNFK